MWCFEEMEEKLAGRVKSVLLLAVSAWLVVCLGKVQETGDKVEQNPIDMYFETVSTEHFSDNQEYAYALIYQECWEKELAHAYKQLGQKSPLITKSQEGVPEAGVYFLKYARSQGNLEAFFSREETEAVETAALAGKQSVAGIYGQTRLLKEQTLKIYEELLGAEGYAASQEQFVFSEKETKEMLSCTGLL